jgi:hypothetical protein
LEATLCARANWLTDTLKLPSEADPVVVVVPT